MPSYYRQPATGFFGSGALLDDIISIHLADYAPRTSTSAGVTQASGSASVQNTNEAPTVGANTSANTNARADKPSKLKSEKKTGNNQAHAPSIQRVHNTKPRGNDPKQKKSQKNAGIDQLTAAMAQMSVSAGSGNAAEGHTRPNPGRSVNQKPKQGPKGSVSSRKLTADPSTHI
ncbi:hypothetical protein FRC08_015144 [Ceratobasidium sp. 394]|nr:hypothetical protein FRC08_015144 [Ceratobasidium sp. 394]